VYIIDIQGKMICKGQNIQELDVSGLPNGSYLMELTDLDSGKKAIEKLVIFH